MKCSLDALTRHYFIVMCKCFTWNFQHTNLNEVISTYFMFSCLSEVVSVIAAEGQIPRNYSSCCCCCFSCCSWIFRLIYALSTSTTMLAPIFKYFKFSVYLSILPLYTSITSWKHKLTFQFSVVYKSEVIKNDLSPTWKSAKIKVRDLCNGDYNRPLKIDIYDWDSNGKHDIIGTIRTNLHELR